MEKNEIKIWQNIISNIYNAPYYKFVVEKIEPRESVILCLGSYFHEALSYYSENYEELPCFCILDYEDYKFIDAILRYCKSNDITIINPTNRPSYLSLTKVLYFAQRDVHLGYCGLQHMGDYLCRYNICNGYLIEKRCIKYLYKRNPQNIDFIKKYFHSIANIDKTITDSESRKIFYGYIKSIISGKIEFIPQSGYAQYFHPNCKPSQSDVIIEGGIDNGISTMQFKNLIGDRGVIHAFEPLENSYNMLVKKFENINNIYI